MENYRVLIVTDDMDDAGLLTDTLARATDGPFSTTWARSLSDAIGHLTTSQFDIVLLSLSLSDSTDVGTFDALFKLAPSVPIMALCEDGQEVIAIEAVKRGAQGYLSKGHFQTALMPQALQSVIQRKRVEEALFLEKERARVTLESIGDGVLSTDVAGSITYLNAEAERMTGWTRDQARGRPISEVFHLIESVSRKTARNPVELVIEQKKSMALYAMSVLVRKDGHEAPIEDSASPIFDQHGNVTGAVVVFRDVSATRALADKMAHLAQHDYLTGLPNRLLMHDRLTQAIALAKRNRFGVGVLFLDLDNFKHINDSLGHSIGDKLLESVAKRLQSQVRHSDTVSRLGGDEFVVLVMEDKPGNHVVITAEKVLHAMSTAHQLAGHELHVTTSIGISLYPADGQDAETLIKNADTAMYHAKKRGRNNYQFFNSDMNLRAVERQTTEAELRRAIDRSEFVLHYQPKIELATGKINGAEALVRWLHPEHGLTLPGSFIAVAEDSGLIIAIGRMVLRLACGQAKAWIDGGVGPVPVAVNVSALELRHPHFLDSVRSTLQETGLDPHYLQLELTETVLMRNLDANAPILHELKKLGVQIAIDDFGTGYSSLSYLRQLPIDVLKIDQSFVQSISAEDHDGVIVSAVIGIGANLHRTVIAEGIENQQQLTFLNAHHCNEGQGFLFSAAVPPEEFEKLSEQASKPSP